MFEGLRFEARSSLKSLNVTRNDSLAAVRVREFASLKQDESFEFESFPSLNVWSSKV